MSTNPTSKEAKKEREVALNELKKAVHDLREALSDSVEAGANEASTSTRAHLQDVIQQLNGLAGETRDRVRDGVQEAEDSVRDGLAKTEQSIRRKPFSSVGIALGVGVLAGLILGKD